MFSPSHKMPALLAFGGNFEDPAGSTVFKLQKVQLQLRCPGPQLALSSSLGLPVLCLLPILRS